jgi:predicted nuclease of restriction endonuclease-like (RecB) superfamily
MPAKEKPAAKRAPKKTAVRKPTAADDDALFGRVATILEQARANVVRAVNHHMVLAYWLIGREIVQEIQEGGERAAYGKQVLENLSRRLTERFGSGFSVTSLKYFRTFYLAYPNRRPLGDDLVPALPGGSQKAIRRPMGDEFTAIESASSIQHPVGIKLDSSSRKSSKSRPLGAELAIRHPAGDEFTDTESASSIQHPTGAELLVGFSPQLSWSHFRALMRVENTDARDFYEREAIAGAWDKRTLERQIHSYYFERLLKSQNPEKMLASGRDLQVRPEPAVESLRNPYVLEFLGLPEVAKLRESDLESAILNRLQGFLLELGGGFAFVARQKRLRFERQILQAAQ